MEDWDAISFWPFIPWVPARCHSGLRTCTVRGQAQAASDFHTREYAKGALATFSNCSFNPDDPPATRFCVDYRVFYAQIAFTADGPPKGQNKTPFAAIVEIFTFDTVTDELVSLETGWTSDVTGIFDETHLRSAQMDAPGPIQLMNIDLSTGEATPSGRTATLGPMTWTSVTDRFQHGNDGPSFDMPKHISNSCETANFHAHEKFRLGTVEGDPPIIDGTPVEAPFVDEGVIFNSKFYSIHVTKENCA